MLPRFNTKDKIILLITEFKKKKTKHKQKKPNKNKPINKNQEKI